MNTTLALANHWGILDRLTGETPVSVIQEMVEARLVEEDYYIRKNLRIAEGVELNPFEVVNLVTLERVEQENLDWVEY